MDIYQLKTFAEVARSGSITRASQRLHLSQPAVSAHIKAIEESLGLELFERTARGMTLTPVGQQVLAKADSTLAAHQGLLDEAKRLKGRLSGKLVVGVDANANARHAGELLTALADRCPEVEVSLLQSDAHGVLSGLRERRLDLGFYNEPDSPAADLTTRELSRFGIFLAAPASDGPERSQRPWLRDGCDVVDWQALADVPWICPAPNTCCGRAAESLFVKHGIRPHRIIEVDRESVTCTLVAAGVGVGLLHHYTATQARDRGEVTLLSEVESTVAVMLAHLSSRADEPLLQAAMGAPLRR